MIPKAYLYNSAGTVLVYTFTNILSPIEGWPNTDNPKNVTYSNLRSAGELSIAGGSNSYDIILRGRLTGANYEALISAFSTLQTTIVANTPYLLKIETSPTPTYSSINVKRKGKIEIVNTNNLTSWLYYSLTFRALAW
jgi:hypothetical protein